ncbi:protein containg leucine rich repeat [Longilinea arvoryzae]|uniref:non-specific serine/threonine protein kinase n=1 Tax=Longilinea arvoryzae TaxID=360412 RepID=A0A0K8MZF2_9CHLR|nr:protein kinase [Longilinea arvoryzae]GAP16017.1 protein containg leucine rich repeat [Longilinea arvoryzae]
MTDALIAEFLATFDDRRFPVEFLQKYELLECLSHNELGETFLIKDRNNEQHCVAKCYSDRSLLSRTTESELLKRLHHKGLPAYIAEYQNETMQCIVREYAPGVSLDQLAREKAFNRQQAVSIILQLSEILIYLHGQTPAIIHRDIKPQNIIIDEQGQITLIDFGISRNYNEGSQEDTVIFGTRHYSPPEQYGFSQTDCRSDIYSLGVLLGWLLTGNADVQQAVRMIPETWLARVVERCTAFAPKDRYKNAAQVRDALTGQRLRRWVLPFTLAAAIFLAALLAFPNFDFADLHRPAGVTFKEPLIEQAVRLALGKGTDAEISEQDLLAVTAIYVFGDKAAADEAAFKEYSNTFARNGSAFQRGSIASLEDLVKLKNLRRLSLCYQNITDLSPLASLNYLELIDLKHNPIEDVSPLAGLTSLSSLILFDTRVSDLTSLNGCLRLSLIDAGSTRIQSTAAFEGLNSLRTLVLRKAPLRSLDKIDTLPLLEELYLSETQLLDLTPLLGLTRLQVVEVDESMRSAVETIEDRSRFGIIYP